jgi:F420-non-reducing hydrogenase large subunit
LEIGGQVIKHRAYAQEIQAAMGGKATHPVCGLPGGVSKPITEEERQDFETKAKSMVEFARFSLKIFEDVVLKNKEYLDIILSDAYTMKSYYMGLVDGNNRVNFYDGDIRVVDLEGKEVAKFKPADYLDYIAEHTEPWSYLKFPFLKRIGWKGLVEGKDSGIYRVAPLARLNVADGMATPLAQEEYDKMFKTIPKPVHHTLAMHWARLIEFLYAAERLLELCCDEEITDSNVRIIPTATPDEGVGVVEAPRGTLFHHYQTDDRGILRKVNLIVATGNNHAAICMSIKKAAQAVIKAGKEVTEGLLNMVEMAFRAYDPCFACATHYLPGQMPLEVIIRDNQGNIIKTLSRV